MSPKIEWIKKEAGNLLSCANAMGGGGVDVVMTMNDRPNDWTKLKKKQKEKKRKCL